MLPSLSTMHPTCQQAEGGQEEPNYYTGCGVVATVGKETGCNIGGQGGVRV